MAFHRCIKAAIAWALLVKSSAKQFAFASFALATLSVAGCDGSALATSSSSTETVSSESVSSDAASSSSSDSARVPLTEQQCDAPNGLQISDIASIVDWINAMEKPLSLQCFVKSLPRPMYYNATLSTFSAQPSAGPNSPRVFFLIGDLVLTVVADERTELIRDLETNKSVSVWDADNIQLLELSYRVDDFFDGSAQSIKGELKFPIYEDIGQATPYQKIDLSPSASLCAVCHAHELLEFEIDGTPVYSSEMLRNPYRDSVSLQFMLNEYSYCDPNANENAWYRCEMLDAIYGQGALVWKDFPESFQTIFRN